MPKPAEITSPVQLVVEGNDQLNFFRAFADHMSLTHVQIQNFGGVSELREFLAALAAEPDFDDRVERLGIVRDSETDADGAFESVQNSLRNAGLPAPERPEDFTQGRHPAVSVLILPGGGRAGMLETLVCESFAGDPVDRCIDEFFDCVGRAKLRNPDKARAFAYLTTTSEPRHSVGVAARQGQWKLDHAAFGGVRRFLEELAQLDVLTTEV